MIITLTENEFLRNWPESRKDQFSEEALRALFSYYEDLEKDTGEAIEFDPIAICCDWQEMTYEELEDNYGSIGQLKNETTVLEVGDDYLILQSY